MPKLDAMRQIMHVDMDAFFASVEQRDNPELRGLPVAVGGRGQRGVVAAASYEARAFGVRSAMPTHLALRKCQNLVVVRPRFDVYQEVSQQIRVIFSALTPLVEPLSLDEAYLDVSHHGWDWDQVRQAAQQLKDDILTATDLTATTGISTNKFLAKIASGMHKPDGMTLIHPEEIDTFTARLPVDRFYGVGEATADKMRLQGIETGADLRRFDEIELVRRFGKMGRYLYRVARGIDDRAVEPSRPRKSVSVERTYATDLRTDEEIERALDAMIDLLLERIDRIESPGNTLTLKVRYDDFTTLSRQKKTEHVISRRDIIKSVTAELLDSLDRPLKPVRLLGLGVSGFERGGQLELGLG